MAQKTINSLQFHHGVFHSEAKHGGDRRVSDVMFSTFLTMLKIILLGKHLMFFLCM